MSDVLEMLTAPFYAIIDFALAAPAAAVIATVSATIEKEINLEKSFLTTELKGLIETSQVFKDNYIYNISTCILIIFIFWNLMMTFQ